MDKEPDFDNHLMDRSFIDADIPELVDQLTLEEKRLLLAADGWWHTYPIPRLNIPSVKVTDGPSGARGGNAYKMTPATSFANATCLGATFDLDLAREMGVVLAADTKARGALCLLGPTINIQRSPLGGRAFESFSEDPTLSGLISAAYSKALQDNGVSATPKHYLCNDQEHDRVGQDAIVPPRALREVYLRPFQITQALAKPWAIMSSYNKVNGVHVAEHPELLEGVLRKEWGHDGLVMSDWYGTYSTGEALNAGLDLEFPGPTRWRQKQHFDYLVQVHKVDPRQVDILVTRVLQWVQKMVKGSPDLTYAKDKKETTRWDAKESDSKLVRKIVTSGIALLKNEDQILPVRKGKVAVIGPNAKAKVFTGGGSARLQPAWSSTPWEGMVSCKPDGVDLEYSVGTLTAKYYPLLDESFTCADGSVGFDGWHYAITESGEQAKEPVGHDQLYRSELRFNNFKREGLGEHWYTELKATFTSPITGVYEFECTATGKYRFWIDDKLVIEEVDYEEKGTAFYGNGTKEAVVKLDVKEGQKYQIRMLHDTRRPENVRYLVSSGLRYDGIRIGAQPAYDADQAIIDAVKLAKEVDTVVLSVGLNQDWESEGDDRPTLHLPMRSDELVHKVAEANPNTIVVIQGGSAVAMPWLDKVKGVVQAWYGGCEAGTGIADIVYGHVNPSGRLPLTFPKRNLDNPAALSFKSFNGRTYYEEGIWVGYRHYNARQIEPLFPFGFGLSYTTFDYADLQITSVTPAKRGVKADDWKLKAKVTVKNTGSIAGSHSVHFYLSPPPETPTGLKHPEVTLQAFAKVHDLAPGTSKTVEVEMNKYAISHWDEIWNVWRAEPGTWTVKVGRDAQTFFGAETFEVGKDLSWTGL